jgi:hypothetical protein
VKLQRAKGFFGRDLHARRSRRAYPGA